MRALALEPPVAALAVPQPLPATFLGRLHERPEAFPARCRSIEPRDDSGEQWVRQREMIDQRGLGGAGVIEDSEYNTDTVSVDPRRPSPRPPSDDGS